MSLGPKSTKNWPDEDVAKTAQMFFGYLSPNDTSKRSYRVVLNKLLQLHLNGSVQIVYTDNSIQERRVVVYRFTSDQAYKQYRDDLVRSAEGLEKGVWEPYRDDEQYKKWLSLLSEATPATFGYLTM